MPRAAIVQVRGPGGDRADSGDPTVTADKVRQRVDPPQRPGRYTIAYRVVSADGHPITGELAFTLTESAADPADAADAAEKAKEDQAQSAPADTGDHEDPATAPDTSTSAQRDASADSGTSREAGRTAAPQPPPGPAGTAAAPSADDGPGMIPLALLVVAPVLLAAAVVLTLRARRGAADAQDT
ncbi:copper resistance CopC family protein [Thermocatellispora tengchongensis]|uniref:copper resistance CopC family protein n=1 Tax=Thermocatellispora tengchongensis TaxID=1073253 RepID=UPI0036442FD9